MRKVVVQQFVTLDGYAAGPNNEDELVAKVAGHQFAHVQLEFGALDPTEEESAGSDGTRIPDLRRNRPAVALIHTEEYGWEYRLVSDRCHILQFAAATTPDSCRLFQLAAARRNRSGKTLNPKVVGSNPTRPN